jgi:hypothetical protein
MRSHLCATLFALVLCLIAAALSANAQSTRDLGVEGAPGPFVVSLIPSTEDNLKVGDTIELQLRSSARGYAHLYVLSASGKVQLWFENVPIDPSRPLSYPFNDAMIRATAPVGQEQLIFLVTRQPLAGFAKGTVRTPRALRYSHDEFRSALAAKEQLLAEGSWALAEQFVTVED